jgi:hypothetical protein
MSVSINKEKFLSDIAKNMPKIEAAMNDRATGYFTKKVVSEAIPEIDRLLKSPDSLPKKGGKIQFYDTESEEARAKKGWKSNTTDNHLIEMWKVDAVSDNKGRITIKIDNDKLVRGRSGDFFLFDLLWKGTRDYAVPAELSDKRERVVTKGKEYKSGKRKGETRPDKVSYKPSEQDQFKKTHGNAAFKVWERAVKDQQAHQNKLLGKRNWHISAVQQDERRRSTNAGKRFMAEAADRERVARERQDQRLVGEDTFYGGDYSSGEKNTGGTKIGKESITPTTYRSNPDSYKKLIYERSGLVKSMLPPKMHWYNRFTGKYYTEQIFRRGIQGEVLEDFHKYIIGCIYGGIMVVIGERNKKANERFAEELTDAARRML